MNDAMGFSTDDAMDCRITVEHCVDRTSRELSRIKYRNRGNWRGSRVGPVLLW